MNWFYGRPPAPTSATTEPLRFDPPAFDYLGPATPETRAEVKAARKAEQRKATKELITGYLVLFVVAAAFALGTVVGNVTDADVRDVDIPVPSLSGERAEPKNSQPNGLGNQKGTTDGKQGGVHPDRAREVAEGTGSRGLQRGPGVLDRSGPDPQERLGHGSGRGLTSGSPVGAHVSSGERAEPEESAR